MTNSVDAKANLIGRAHLKAITCADLAAYFVAEIDDIIPLQSGKFMEYDGRKWEYQPKIATKYFMKFRDILDELANDLPPDAGTYLRSCIKWLDSKDRIIINRISGLKPHALVDWDSDPCMLNTASGIVDLSDGSVIPHTNKILMSRITEIEYDPNAPEPERWLQFLYEIFDGDEEVIEYVHRVVGYCLTGETREQKMFYLIGKQGANGKSVFLDTIKSLMGDYATTADPTVFTKSTITIRNDLARLKGRRLIILPELDAEARVDELTVKRITGNDEITARFLNHETFEYKPVGKVVVASNYDFKSNGSSALWRRIKSIPFDVSFIGREDMNLRDDLYSERKSIFKWAVEGAIKYYKTGLGNEPRKINNATREMRYDSNSIRKFVVDRTDVGRAGATITKREIYNIYKDWCSDNGHSPESDIKFGKLLREVSPKIKEGIVTIDGKTTRVWKHIELKQEKRTRGISVHPKDFSVLSEAEQRDIFS